MAALKSAAANLWVTIRDQRNRLTLARATTRRLFEQNRLTAQKVISHLNDLYEQRIGKGYQSNPGYKYYLDVINRMTRCHTREVHKTVRLLVSDIKQKFGSNPGGSAKKLIGLLEGGFLQKLETYYRQYQIDVNLEEKLKKNVSEYETDWGQTLPTLPKYNVPPRPEPFETNDDDGDMPDIPKPKQQGNAHGAGGDTMMAHVCGAACKTKDGSCERATTNPGHCYQHYRIA